MTLSRRGFVHGSLAWLPLACRASSSGSTPPLTATNVAPSDPFDPWRSFEELQQTDDLVSKSIERARSLDQGLHAVIEWHPDPSVSIEGRLRGLPFLAKDNIDTRDLDTSAGSLALLDQRPQRDAAVIERLRQAGAVLVGKANLSEWANFRSTRSQSGWSARGGQCVSPWGESRCPCGSSSGTAVAVAAGYVPFALGSETDGSILCPASQCGVVGIKPSAGLVPSAGVVPLSSRQDVVGPMAVSVAAAAAVLEVIAEGQPDYPLDAGALGGAKLGIARGISSTGFHAGAMRLFERAVQDLRQGGAEATDRDLAWATDRGLSAAEFTAMLYEFHHDIAEYLHGRGASQQTLADLIAFNRANADRELAVFGQEIFEQAVGTASLADPAYTEALARCEGVAGQLERSMDGLDALITPTTGPSWALDPVYGDHFSGGSSTSPAAIAGFPTVTVPMGRVMGLPVGLSFIGRKNDEGRILTLAYAYEQQTKHWRPPDL